MIYLIKSTTRDGTYFKVGFTHNLFKRLIPYATHNPNYKLLEIIKTYHKTNRQLEVDIHKEIIAMGYQFKVADNGIITEWFFVPIEKEKDFEKQGLTQFKACKNRKIYKNGVEC